MLTSVTTFHVAQYSKEVCGCIKYFQTRILHNFAEICVCLVFMVFTTVMRLLLRHNDDYFNVKKTS